MSARCAGIAATAPGAGGGKLAAVATEHGAAGCGVTAPLRAAEISDSRSIAQFHTGCWREAYRGLVPQEYLDRVDVDDRAKRWRDRLVDGGRQAALAEVGERIVGVVSWAERFYRKHGFAPDGERQVDGDTGVWEVRMIRGR